MAKTKPPPAKKPSRTRTRPEDIESLDPPNHLMSKVADARSKWPLLMLRAVGGDRDDFLFVSTAYLKASWPDACEHPPSWMDPEMFVRTVRKNADAIRLIEACQASGKTGRLATQLAQRLDQIFLTVYLPTIKKLFSQGRSTALAQWLIANRAWQLSDPKRPINKRGVRRARSR